MATQVAPAPIIPPTFEKKTVSEADAEKAIKKKKLKKRNYHDLDKYIRTFSDLQSSDDVDLNLIGFGTRTLPAINELIYGFLDWACEKLVDLAQYSNTKTVTVDKILILVRRLVFSTLDDEDEVMKENLDNVITKINSHVKEFVKNVKNLGLDEDGKPTAESSDPTTSATNKPINHRKSSMAMLVLPVSRFGSMLKVASGGSLRQSALSAVALTALIEYILNELLLELKSVTHIGHGDESVKAARAAGKRVRATPTHVTLALQRNKLLWTLLVHLPNRGSDLYVADSATISHFSELNELPEVKRGRANGKRSGSKKRKSKSNAAAAIATMDEEEGEENLSDDGAASSEEEDDAGPSSLLLDDEEDDDDVDEEEEGKKSKKQQNGHKKAVAPKKVAIKKAAAAAATVVAPKKEKKKKVEASATPKKSTPAKSETPKKSAKKATAAAIPAANPKKRAEPTNGHAAPSSSAKKAKVVEKDSKFDDMEE